ncbi:MAG TPA: prepilin-type N-terminal cleavage/methylation domain-containing protein [Armatimonadota bacterium]|jgi:prepilin-type N-terminal cleavage/methylation domain-containing protein/prepilin-type processing-associated H-X9-DG protein|nr:prepilin-type N-terminal cleavage/methylation domain-containing protein [Armatimonadota bacterium]
MMGQIRVKRGFTLIELLVVIAIIAILAAILFPVFAKARARSQTTACMSNMKQIGNALMLYVDDHDQRVMYNWYEWHVDLDHYVKTGQIFECPSSRAPKVYQKDFTNAVMSDGTRVSGKFWTNMAAYPRIYGHYAKNEEFMANYGYSQQTYTGAEHNIAKWKSTSDIIIIAESKAGAEDPDKGNWGDNNSPYIEPGSTTWNEVWDQLTARHNNGQNCIFADGHAQFKHIDWFKTQEGKHAICPAKENLGPTATF